MDLKKRAENMRQFFNRKASEDAYDCVHLKMMNNKEPITKALPEGTKRVLDLGGGTGLELIALFERFPDARATVVDVAEEMLNQLKKRPFADRVDIVCGDFFEVDFGGDYDAVISTAALHHFTVADKVRLYRKSLEALRPGGMLINSDKCVATQEEQDYAFKELAEEPNKYNHMDTPLTSENERKALKSAGFVGISVEPIPDSNYFLIVGIKPE